MNKGLAFVALFYGIAGIVMFLLTSKISSYDLIRNIILLATSALFIVSSIVIFVHAHYKDKDKK